MDRRRREEPPARWPLVLGGVMVLAASSALVWMFKEDIQTLFAGDPAPTEIVVLDAGEQPELSLEDGDQKLKEFVAESAFAAEVKGWLGVEGIIQRLAAAARLVSQGKSPAPVLSFLDFKGDFSVDEEIQKPKKKRGRGKRNKSKKAPAYAERVFMAPQSYARYDRYIEIFAATDMSLAARTYHELKPYFEAAFAQVAKPDEQFDSVLTSAIERLLAVKVPEGKVELVPKGALYQFKDPALEALSPAEKHIIRLGPRNARRFQDGLRRFADRAGLSLSS